MSDRTAYVFDSSDRSSPAHYSASQTCVLLLDFHGLFQSMHPSIPMAVEQATNLLTWARSNKIAIAHCLVNNDASIPFPPTIKDAKRLTSVMEKFDASEDSYLEPKPLRPINDENTFLRTGGYVSALKSEGLVSYLSSHGYQSLILCGVSTSGCVMRTAFAASDADYVVTVVEDACADPAEGVHEMCVRKVLPNRAHVLNVEDLKREWAGVKKK